MGNPLSKVEIFKVEIGITSVTLFRFREFLTTKNREWKSKTPFQKLWTVVRSNSTPNLWTKTVQHLHPIGIQTCWQYTILHRGVCWWSPIDKTVCLDNEGDSSGRRHLELSEWGSRMDEWTLPMLKPKQTKFLLYYDCLYELSLKLHILFTAESFTIITWNYPCLC